jgi:hypothetical protein
LEDIALFDRKGLRQMLLTSCNRKIKAIRVNPEWNIDWHYNGCAANNKNCILGFFLLKWRIDNVKHAFNLENALHYISLIARI